MLRAGLYARVSTNDQQTLPMQNRAMREYAARRGWIVAMQVREVGSGVAKRQAREKLLEAARRREIDVVLVWRLDRWGRSVTDLLTTLQELEHLGVGFVSLTEALDLTTSTGRAMAGLLSVFSEFEREILRERTRAGLAHARQHGKVLGRPMTAGLHAADIRKLHLAGRQQVRDRPPVTNRPYFGPANPGGKVMSRRKRDPAREDRIHNEAIVDAGPDEQALSWYYYLENKIRFPFQAKCLSAKVVSPLKKDQTVRAIRMAPDDLCAHDMLVLVRWQDRKMAVPLSQLTAVDPDESTAEAIGDWHYWVAQGYCL
jgi:putative DNA-invertase from lambdoid prophage Rac